jgi:hypothetical protein
MKNNMAARFRHIHGKLLLVCDVCSPVRPSACTSVALTGRIFVKFDIEDLH